MPKVVDFRRRGLFAAALGSAGVLAVLLVQDIAMTIVWLLGSIGFSSTAGSALGSAIAGSWTQSLTTSLPFSIGVFVSLWQLAPIGAVLRLTHVITRSLLAAGIGAGAVLIVGTVINLVQGVTTFVDRDFAFVASDSRNLVVSLGYALQTAASTFVTVVPVVVLAGVLLWMWTRTTDREHPVEGALDL